MKNNMINILEKQHKVIVYDLETEGLSYRKDRILTIDALKFKDGKLIDTFHMKGTPSGPIQQIITDITGLTDNDFLEGTSTEQEIAAAFSAFLDDDYVLMSYNGNFFDDKFIQKIGVNNTSDIDVYKLVKLFNPWATVTDNLKLEEFNRKVLKLEGDAHNSAFDALLTYRLYEMWIDAYEKYMKK